MALDRKMIVNAALDLLDQHGLEGLTMRRLAEALDVQAPSLYWHYADKPTLLDDMADVLLESVANGQGSADFRATLRHSAADLRRALGAHRDGALLHAGARMIGGNARRLAETITAALLAAGFDAPTAARAGSALLAYVLGFVIDEQAQDGKSGPHAGQADRDAAFAFGVDLLVRGLGSPPAAHGDKVNDLVKAWQKLG